MIVEQPVTSAPIAVLGGYGAVGTTAARRLSDMPGRPPLRIGGRDPAAAELLCAQLPAGASAWHVDLDDPRSLARFCEGTAAVVNCAGPSYRVLDLVARAAWAAGAHYVDVAGDLPVRKALESGAPAPDGAVAVLSAGVMPGLTGLLPATLLDDRGDSTRIDIHVGGSTRMTPASAADILLATGPEHGTSLACWRAGEVVQRALRSRWNTELHCFPSRVHAMPFLTAEAVDVARRHGLAELRQHSVYASERIPTVLATAWAHLPADPLEWMGDLAQAAETDLREHGRYYVVLAERRITADQPDPDRWVAVRTADPYELSGVVTALAAWVVLSGDVPGGVYTAAEVLDPFEVLHKLASEPLAQVLHGGLIA